MIVRERPGLAGQAESRGVEAEHGPLQVLVPVLVIPQLFAELVQEVVSLGVEPEQVVPSQA